MFANIQSTLQYTTVYITFYENKVIKILPNAVLSVKLV